jgi:hypothetical protein
VALLLLLPADEHLLPPHLQLLWGRKCAATHHSAMQHSICSLCPYCAHCLPPTGLRRLLCVLRRASAGGVVAVVCLQHAAGGTEKRVSSCALGAGSATSPRPTKLEQTMGNMLQ